MGGVIRECGEQLFQSCLYSRETVDLELCKKKSEQSENFDFFVVHNSLIFQRSKLQSLNCVFWKTDVVYWHRCF